MEVGNMFGFGLGGGLALAAVIIISSRIFNNGKSAKDQVDVAPQSSPRPWGCF